MKDCYRDIGLAIILGVMIPGVILQSVVSFGRKTEEEPKQTEIRFVEQPEVGTETICVQNENGTLLLLDLEDYITGVVLAEMPASFEKEALKAQAVVARTYAVRAREGKSKHADAATCMVSSCCQSFRWPEEFLSDGGSADNYEKVRLAVKETAGQVLTYDGELIEATYFSCSGGSTEDAVAVWGTEVPYLVSTLSPGEENATHYEDVTILSLTEFCQMLNLSGEEPSDQWFGKPSYTAGGGIDTIEICSQTFTGVQLRKLLNLKSTVMTFKLLDNSIEIRTKGYGHRVGMSQYGADVMALQGNSYAEILAHYYRGVVLQNLSD